MKRRHFSQLLAGGAIGAGAASCQKKPEIGTPVSSKKNLLMHVGGDYHSVAGDSITSKENLEYNLRFGVQHLMAQVSKSTQEGAWDSDELKMMKDNCDKYGVNWEKQGGLLPTITGNASPISLKK